MTRLAISHTSLPIPPDQAAKLQQPAFLDPARKSQAKPPQRVMDRGPGRAISRLRKEEGEGTIVKGELGEGKGKEVVEGGRAGRSRAND